MKKIIAIVVLLAFFVGCGGGSSSTRSNIGTGTDTNTTTPAPSGTPKEVVQMITGEVYSVYPGDEIKKSSTDAKVRIIYNKSVDSIAVALVEGSAIINHY